MSRLLMFPEPFPDEDIRSIVFRYHVRSVNVEFYESRYELFGIRSYKQTVFPKRLNVLFERLPIGNKFTVDSFLFEHTWYGLYKAFFTSERNRKMLHIMKYGSDTQGNPNGQPTTGFQSILSSEIKYCPECVIEDEQKFGEIYVHRLHQVAFLHSCPKHHVRLLTKCPVCKCNYGNVETGKLLQAASCKLGHAMYSEHVNLDEREITLQYDLLEDMIFIRDKHDELSNESIFFKCLEQLFKRGYITSTGVHLKKALLSDVIASYSPDLIILNMDFSSVYFKNAILNREMMTNFIGFYLLLARFLCGSFKGFMSSKDSLSLQIPFGVGPWACENSKCVNHNIPMIKSCIRKIVNGRLGIYSISYDCESCNLTTILKGTPTSYKVSFHNRRILEAVSKVYGLQEIIDAQDQTAAGIEIDTYRAKLRRDLSKLLEQNTFQKRSDIRRSAESMYRWFMRNDKEWFENKIPRMISQDSIKLNFQEIDLDLQVKIRAVGESMDPNYHLPIRRGTILNLLNQKDRNRFRHYCRDKLPASKQEIERFVESKKQFLIRSIPRHYSKLVEQGVVKITVNKLKEASVSYYLNGDDEVDRHILIFLQEKGALH